TRVAALALKVESVASDIIKQFNLNLIKGSRIKGILLATVRRHLPPPEASYAALNEFAIQMVIFKWSYLASSGCPQCSLPTLDFRLSPAPHNFRAFFTTSVHHCATLRHGRHNCTVTSRSPGVLSGTPPPVVPFLLSDSRLPH